MAKLLKLRRGTTTQHSSFTGAEGEVTVDTDKETLVVHDGSTAGGHPVAAEDMANVSSASIAGRLANDSIATSKIAAGALPTDVTVQTANIVNGTIVDADVNTNAAIAGTKISPSFGSQNIATTGTATFGNNISVTGTSPFIDIVDSDNNSDYKIHNDNGSLKVRDMSNSNATRLQLHGDGTFDVYGNLDANNGIDVTGTANLAGTTNITGGVLNLGAADSASGHLNSFEVMTFNIDSDNDDTNRYFAFYKNGNSGSGTELFKIEESGQATVTGNLDVSSGVDVTGNITVSGTVDGVDVAALNTTVGNLGISNGSIASGTTAVTQGQSANNTQIATTSFVQTAIANLVDSSPGALNTLNELAAAINDDASFSTTVNNNIATKMPLSGGEFTGDVTCHNITPDGDSSRNLGTNSVRFANVYADNFVGGGGNLTGIVSFVSGMIIMYNSSSPPSGWYLCNGQNGTPDLRDRFIVGAGNSYSLNATGGSNTATDTVSISGSDTVNITISGSGTTANPNQSGIQYGRPGYYDCAQDQHTHNFSFSGSGSDTVSISGSDTVSVDTRSPYYALTFIMKA